MQRRISYAEFRNNNLGDKAVSNLWVGDFHEGGVHVRRLAVEREFLQRNIGIVELDIGK